MDDMTYKEIVTLLAILVGPILAAIVAIQTEKFLERRRDEIHRKIAVFKTLMATRGSILSFAHVEALNRIDLEFSGDKKFKKVIDSWKEYFDNLLQKSETTEQITVWSARNDELRANLLYEMGQSLDYNFDKVLIKRNIYSPVGHDKVQREEELLTKGMLEVLNGERAIPMYINIDEDTIKRQNELHGLLVKYLEKEIEKKA